MFFHGILQIKTIDGWDVRFIGDHLVEDILDQLIGKEVYISTKELSEKESGD